MIMRPRYIDNPHVLCVRGTRHVSQDVTRLTYDLGVRGRPVKILDGQTAVRGLRGLGGEGTLLATTDAVAEALDREERDILLGWGLDMGDHREWPYNRIVLLMPEWQIQGPQTTDSLAYVVEQLRRTVETAVGLDG